MRKIRSMPVEYEGEPHTHNGISTSTPRKWTQPEIEWATTMKQEGYTVEEIAHSTRRSVPSVVVKLKRMAKKKNTYNAKHVEEKHQLNQEFIELIKPKTILDLYSGPTKQYPGAITNDINPDYDTTHTKDALKLVCKLYAEDARFDFIDLDPYGSAFDSLDLAIKMAKKGIAITLGEMGHIRFSRLDFVRSHYGIETKEEFTGQRLVEEIIKIGHRNKKELTVWNYREWKNIGRVWFTIGRHKITSQWKNMAEPSKDPHEKQLSLF